MDKSREDSNAGANEWDALERELRARSEAPDANTEAAVERLRPQVLAAMKAAAQKKTSNRGSGRRFRAMPLWVFASSAAAAVVLLVNLALSSALARPLVVADATATRVLAAELRGLLPELDEREALRQALLLQARGRTPEMNLQQTSAGVFSARRIPDEVEP